MINPRDFQGIPEQILAQFRNLEKMLIWDIARRINSETNEKGNYTQTAEKQMQDMVDMGYDPKLTRELLAKQLGVSASVVDTMIYEYGKEVYQDDHNHYAKVGKSLLPFERNGFVTNIIRATQDELKEKLLNLSGTTGFVDSQGKFHGVDDYYNTTLNKAVFQVSSGSFDVQSVMRRVVKELGDSGVRTVNYESGVSRSLESAVRTNILTGMSQLAGKISLQNAIDMGEDIMELTAHAGARPTHTEWQGQLVSLSGRNGYLSTEDIGYGDVTGFKGVNCYHDWYPFFEGISKRKYTQEQLDEFNDDSPKYEYNGKWYNEYEAGQKMRQIERSIAHTKRELVGYDAIDDKDMFTARSIYLRRQRELYDEFAEVSGKQKMPMNQLVYNFDRKKASQATWAYKNYEKNKELVKIAEKLYNIDTRKFTQYALNPDKQPDKARAFKEALGYDLSNYDNLIQDVKINLKSDKFISKGSNDHGELFEQALTLIGPNGKNAKVLTAWIKEIDKDKLRMTSIYIKKRRKENGN